MSGPENNFGASVPAWRARRLRAYLMAQSASGAAAEAAGDPRAVPSELAHRAEMRRWLNGWDRASGADAPAAPKPPSARQLASITRWEAGTGRLPLAEGALRRDILEAVADAMLSVQPLAFGAIAAAHRETVKRCREAGLPAPRASRYRRWLKLTGRVGARTQP
ncbi:hypothetical protein ACFQI3_01290 [Hansschlegelia quercus]|uniref:Uncharacterized protein n=1 Tax=Hansschlegelia quercus TaxID=2528245 RepID=A0A4Q9G8S6_9HYPH|nr:hypothetical protein [Hansschlegelia quercus]TBN47021.1 hypothetical protein EYR15_16570 [Hansschlegelia quercus]